MPESQRTQQLRRIKEKIVNCKKCFLYEERVKNSFCPVIGEGSHFAKIMFVGEGPGLTEAKTGRPFCGAAGKVLDELLESIGIERKSVYITNIIKDRPPRNRDPNLEEIKACAPFLLRQIAIIRPKVICPLGNYATVFLLTEFGLADKIKGISRIHGKVFKAKADYGEIEIISMYHPAVAIYNANMKNTLKDDFEVLKKYETVQKKID